MYVLGIYVYIYLCIYSYAYVCTHVSIYVCICLCMFIDPPPLVSTEASRQGLLCRLVMTKFSLRLFIILLVENGVTKAQYTDIRAK